MATFFSLLGLAVNSEFNYKRYFSMTPTGGPQPYIAVALPPRDSLDQERAFRQDRRVVEPLGPPLRDLRGFKVGYRLESVIYLTAPPLFL